MPADGVQRDWAALCELDRSKGLLAMGVSRSLPSSNPLCFGASTDLFTILWCFSYWVQLCAGALCWVLCVFFFPETRGDVILKKRCARLEKETGRHHFVHGLDVHENWKEAFKVSCSRPLIYLVSRPREFCCIEYIVVD